MFRFVRPTHVLVVATSLIVLLRNVAGDDSWKWSLIPSPKNDVRGACDIPACSQLYGQSGLTTDALKPCFEQSQFSCSFNAVGDPGVTSLPIVCPGSASKVAQLDISALLPTFGDSIYSNGSAWIEFKNKPDGSLQCDFSPYVGKWRAPAQQCLDDIDDTYWVPDTTNGVITSMAKRFELSLYKVIEGGVSGYYLYSPNWTKCGNSIMSVTLSDQFKVVVSMAGNINKEEVTTTTPAPKSTTSTSVTSITSTTQQPPTTSTSKSPTSTSTTTKRPAPGQTNPADRGTGALDVSDYTGTGEGVGGDVVRVSVGLMVAMMVVTAQL